MKPKNKLNLILSFTVLYLIFFTVLAVIKKNYEFIYYIFIMVVLITLTVYLYRKLLLTYQILIGLSVLGILHIMGGVIIVNGMRLYDFYLVEPVLRYDFLVHSFGIFMATLVIYNLIHPYLMEKTNKDLIAFCFILVSSAMGVGALNEIIELFAVLYLNASNEVGNYFNNAFDLVFNLIGALLACFYILKYDRRTNAK